MIHQRTVSRKQIITLFFLGLLFFILYHVFLILSPFAVPIFWAMVISFSTFPIFVRLRKAFRCGDGLAAFLTTLLLFMVLTPIVVLLARSLGDELLRFYHWILESLENGRFESWIEQVKQWPWLDNLKDKLYEFDPIRANAREWLRNQVGGALKFLGHETGIITRNTLLFVAHALLTFFLSFFFLRDGEKIYSFIYECTPLEDRTKKEVFSELNRAFSAVLRGQLITSIIQSVLAAGIFLWLGLPMPMVLAALTFIASLVPVFGAATIWFPFVVYLFLIGNTTKALILFSFGVGVISLADNFIKPLVIGEETKLPYSLLFLGILGGLKVYGFMGAFIAPLVLSIFFVLVRIYREKFLL